ncbi:MAG: nucleoside kinase [Firmicutes bacterium]|nr:nucleoside kinase [Bacillota bacterium]
MEKTVRVEYKGKLIKEYPIDTQIKQIANDFQHEYAYPILVAKVDNDIVELSEKITKKCKIDFYDRSSAVGNAIYSRGVHFLMIVAIKKVLGNDVDVRIEHSIDKGVYCEIENVEVTEEILSQIEKKMEEISQADYNFVKLNVARRDAIHFFQKRKQMDKVKVLKYISNTFVNLYRLDEYYDYFFSEMPYSTKVLDDFKLTYISDNGFVLSYPSIDDPRSTKNYKHHEKLFNAFLEYTEMGRTLNINTAADLNEVITTGNYNYLIQLSEARYNSQLASVAESISKNKNIKVVLLAGPSSSGKTTTSKKLEIYLRAHGFVTHSISTDDYFYSLKDTPKKENGEYDFESIRAVDTDLFNKQLLKLLNGEKVLLPEYNFILGEREYKKKWLQLKENDIIVIEGLHALNPELTLAIDDINKYKIYISPLTQLNIDKHNRIHTSDTRRLRRIIRDNQYRGYNAAETLRNWHNIKEGEEEYVFPFQNDADVVINSALIYELGVLKTYAEPLLFSVDEEDEVYPEAIRLINFLRNFLPIPSDNVPIDSVLREFIGGSCFHEK